MYNICEAKFSVCFKTVLKKKKIMIILFKEYFSKEFYNTNVTEVLINNVNIDKSKYHFLKLIYRFIICIGPFVFENGLCKKDTIFIKQNLSKR